MTSTPTRAARRLLLAAAVACLLAPLPRAAEKPASPPAPDPAMEAWLKYSTPGPQHALLGKMAGSWKTVTKTWMGPGEPMVGEGTNTTQVILGGRFIQDQFKGTLMGESFEGVGLTGYDLVKNEYTGTWVDTMGTGMTTVTGKADASGKVINWVGIGSDPMTQQVKTYRMVTRFVSDSSHVFEIYETVEGKEMKTMEIAYTRQ